LLKGLLFKRVAVQLVLSCFRIDNPSNGHESRLVEWLAPAYQQHGPELEGISGSAGKAGKNVDGKKRLGNGHSCQVIDEAVEFSSRA